MPSKISRKCCHAFGLGCFGLGRFGLDSFGLGRFGLGRIGLALPHIYHSGEHTHTQIIYSTSELCIATTQVHVKHKQ